MRRFTQLFMEMDRTTRTNLKVAALVRYFHEAPPEDAAWAVHILTGRKLMRALSSTRLRAWVAQEANVPAWLVDECFDAVGDLAETLALLLPDVENADPPALHTLIEERLLPLRTMDEMQQRNLVVDSWRRLDLDQRFLYHKLISGSFRVGVAAKLVVRALAEVAGVDEAVMAHRLMGRWSPTAVDYLRLLAGGAEGGDPAQPYPFMLAYPLDVPVTDLGPPADWQVEWKWDGIRAQLIRRGSLCVLWSRGEELVHAAFPEIADAATSLPRDAVLDGEILAWEDEAPLPFQDLQRRINRKSFEPVLWHDVPVVLQAFDLLEESGADVRAEPLEKRRERLSALLGEAKSPLLRLSPFTLPQDWTEVDAMVAQADARRVEGIMLKRCNSAYGVGRQRGVWWKWKRAPHTVDAVLIYAQQGNGRRASLFTDYTFGVWDQGELVPFAKAYSGLTDEEIREVDAFIRRNTLDRRGPVRFVKPELVFELAFERLQRSNRHRSGIAVRFPRMARWRKDKLPADADTLESIEALLESQT